MLGVKSVPIEFGVNGKRRWLSIQNLLQLQIEGTAGADANQESLSQSSIRSCTWSSCGRTFKQICL